VTLLPQLAADSPIGAARGLRIKTFARPAPGRTIGVVWRRSTTRGRAIEGVVAAIRDAMQEESKR
jgi:LysR family hydrogen peroxide-inducible transcriptional activator